MFGYGGLCKHKDSSFNKEASYRFWCQKLCKTIGLAYFLYCFIVKRHNARKTCFASDASSLGLLCF